MVDLIIKLLKCFPGSFINNNYEFIAHKYANEYCAIVQDEIELKAKVIEAFSRGASKGMPYAKNTDNKKFNAFMLNGINEFLNTNFSKEDIEIIYTYLGYGIKHEDTIEFINSNYDMNFFKKYN